MGVLSSVFGLIKYIVLVLFGIILNFYIQDPYIVAGASFLVSLVLFRQGKRKEETPPTPQAIQTRRVQSPAPRTPGRFCPNCGAQLSNNGIFCGACGSRLKQPRRVSTVISDRYRSDEILEQVQTMRTLYTKGELDQKGYMNILTKSVFQDSWNRIWSIGANSLRWYRLDSGRWIPDQPVGTLAISSR